MGFSLNKAAQTITIVFEVPIVDELTGKESFAKLTHKFRRPSIKERELYRQMAHRFEHGKSQLRLTKANLALWESCIMSVEGYDDLPEGDFKPYFLNGSDVGKEHADAATRIMLDKITENEADLEKNSD